MSINVNGCVMGSLDVESLFTNVPLTEAIGIVSDGLFEDRETVDGLVKSDLESLLSWAVRWADLSWADLSWAVLGIFTFNGNYYIQTDGVSMGSPLGPTLANAFLSFKRRTG